MKLFYNLGIYLYKLILVIAALFNRKAQKWIDGRKNYWQNLPKIHEQVVWFHCASLGEYDQGKPIMEAWKKKYPQDFILVTFFSPSGYDHIKDKSIGDYTCYVPLDTPRNSRRFIQHFKPKITFFIKYEIWVNLLTQAKLNGSELYLLSALFRGTQHFFKWYGWTSRKGLRLFDRIFTQYEFNKSLLYSIGIENVTSSGDTRYDRVSERALNKKKNQIISDWLAKNKAFVIGSSWPKDETMLLPYINDGSIEEKIILAPHEVNKDHVLWISEQLKVPYQFYTKVQEGECLSDKTKVLILDCIGVLADAYQYGVIAYVGGGFGTGLHNILEPAAFGLPVIFGPLHQKFLEAQEFIDNKIGISCGSGVYFMKAYQDFKNDAIISLNVKSFMSKKQGATDIVMNYFDRK